MTWALRAFGKAMLKRIFVDYRINYIYAGDHRSAALQTGSDSVVAPLTPELASVLETSATAKLRNSMSYSRAGLDGLAILEQGIPLCVAHFADQPRYDRTQTWPLRADEMALMDIVTEDAMRGRGLAVRLIAAATRTYLAGGKRRMIAFIWWSNTQSLRAFSKAGWRRIGISIEFRTVRGWHAIQIPFWN